MKRAEHDKTETGGDNLHAENKRPKHDSEPIVLNNDVSVSRTYRLCAVKNLPAAINRGTVTIDELIGDPRLRIMWQFNFTIDIDFVMNKIHESAKPQLKSTFIYGYSFGRDPTRQRLRQQAKQYDNVHVDGVYLQNRYGTHHSKMMVLFYEDHTCQIVIHTANLIHFDWENTSQGAWTSGRLPLLKNQSDEVSSAFKQDLLKYIEAYDSHGAHSVKKLVDELRKYDFSTVKAILIASVPGNYQPDDSDYRDWGILRLQNVLERENDGIKAEKDDQLIIQCSSVGSLGTEDTYLTPVIKNAMLGQAIYGNESHYQGDLQLVFPTVEEVRTSFNGYSAGGSIFFKRQSDRDVQQLNYLKPKLCKWISERKGAAPHIKTYSRVSRDNKQHKWVLLTSANLSKQAWGTVNVKKSNQWIQSWECGVLLIHKDSDPELPLPYKLPLTKYNDNDEPWSPWQEYHQRDSLGLKWPQ